MCRRSACTATTPPTASSAGVVTQNNADMRALARLSRSELHAHARHYFKTGGRTEPEVALVVYGGAQAILKDYARTPGWFGRLIAPILIWREYSALVRLAGLQGVPSLHRRLDARGLLMEYLPARPWPSADAPDAAYARLRTLVDAMHRRGIAHCDLRAAGNMLVDDQGRPYIVDFVARVQRGARWNLPWNWLYRQFVRADESALAKLRVRYAPHLATAADRQTLSTQGPLERIARAIGENTRSLLRYFVRSR